MVTTTFEAIGTHWQVDLYDVSKQAAGPVWAAMHHRIAQFDQAYSRFRADSLVSQMADQAGDYELPSDAPALLELYHRLYVLTAGAVTPLIGRVLSDAGYDAAYSLQEKPLASPPDWDDILTWDGARGLTLSRPALLDFGAAGKGYLVDLVAAVLRAQGSRAFTIDAGGDIRHQPADGQAPLRIGLEHPTQPGQAVGVVELEAGSLCGSAGNRRRWGRFHHIIDPRSLSSPTDLAAVWVAADTALVADGLATALFFTPPDQLQSRFAFEYALVRSDQTYAISSGFPGELFYT